MDGEEQSVLCPCVYEKASLFRTVVPPFHAEKKKKIIIILNAF